MAEITASKSANGQASDEKPSPEGETQEIVIDNVPLGNDVSRSNSRRRYEMTEKQKREANLGTILVCISLLFIACQSIKIVPDVSND